MATRYVEEVADPDLETKGTWVEPPDLDQALHDAGMKASDLAKLSASERRSAYEALEAARAAGATSLAMCPHCNAPLGGPGVPLGYVTSCSGCHRPLHILISDGRPSVRLT